MPRKPQINFQVEPNLKFLYDEAKAAGQRVTRLCAAGLLMMVEDASCRLDALEHLRAWEARYAAASRESIRTFVQGAERREDACRQPRATRR